MITYRFIDNGLVLSRSSIIQDGRHNVSFDIHDTFLMEGSYSFHKASSTQNLYKTQNVVTLVNTFRSVFLRPSVNILSETSDPAVTESYTD